MQNNHLSDEELQIIAYRGEADEIQQQHLIACEKCSENLKMYKQITSSLNTAPIYDTAHLTSDLIIKKINNRGFSFLFSSKIDIFFIVFLFLAAVTASVVFTNFIPSLKTVDFSVIFKIFTENEIIKNIIKLVSTNSQIFIYLPFIILTLFITLLFEKILGPFRHRVDNT